VNSLDSCNLDIAYLVVKEGKRDKKFTWVLDIGY
jgi:hypothetical protein